MTETNYPAWQKAIRDAQVTQAAFNATQEAEEQAIKAEIDARQGRDLAYVLDVAFGIHVDDPLTNSVEIDGFDFWLKRNSDEYSSTPSFSNSNGSLTFTLRVNAVRPDSIQWDDHWPDSLEFVCRHSLGERHDWTYLRASLANGLDELKRNAAFAIEQKKFNEKRVKASPPESTEEQIAKLIKRLVFESMTVMGEF